MLFADAISEIKSNLKPSFNRPYLWVNVQNALKVRGLYDTGADISCMSEKIFRQIPPQNRPQKLDMTKSPNFCSAGGQPLPVRGLYEFAFSINSKLIKHQCYIIPDLNEPLILGIDFIQQHQLWYCPQKQIFCLGRPAKLGPGPIKSLQCNHYTAPLRRLH
jgi:hypothetical protein